MLLILPATPTVEDVLRHHRQSQNITQLPVGQQSRIAGNSGPLKLQLQAWGQIESSGDLFVIPCCLLYHPPYPSMFIGTNDIGEPKDVSSKWELRA